jgi:hypothetical protein
MGALGIPGAVWRRAAALADVFGADAGELLTGRAAMLRRAPHGQVSAGGATHLMVASDGWWTLTLARADDIAAVPALLEADTVDGDPWPEIRRWATTRTAAAMVRRARLLGLPVARLGETAAGPPRVLARGTPAPPRPLTDLLVADLTSMWAGPLCAQLLAGAGAVVVKVESPSRPDGTRLGDPDFFNWMNTGKLCYAVDFDCGRNGLAALLAVADVVLEGSRPAALTRRGLGPSDSPGPPGQVWLRITGYGADAEVADRVAFGDDAAVAGGLVGYDSGGPVFVGDAIADPLTGLEAAAAVIASLRRGGGDLIEIALAAVAATYAGLPEAPDVESQPLPPAVRAPAAALGADNAAVERLVAERHTPPC